ncbi:MAG: ACT domain-containing protein [Acidimicrobiia bacterium]
MAEAGIPIFVVSSYATDYLLVREADLSSAIGALEDTGHRVDT